MPRWREAFRFEDLETERVDFDGLELSVVTAATLCRIEESDGQASGPGRWRTPEAAVRLRGRVMPLYEPRPSAMAERLREAWEQATFESFHARRARRRRTRPTG